MVSDSGSCFVVAFKLKLLRSSIKQEWTRSAVVSSFRHEDHLKILSLGLLPPLKIVPWKIAKIGRFVYLYSCVIKKVAFACRPQGKCWWSVEPLVSVAAVSAEASPIFLIFHAINDIWLWLDSSSVMYTAFNLHWLSWLSLMNSVG